MPTLRRAQGRRLLQPVLDEYLRRDNAQGPHHGLGLAPPEPLPQRGHRRASSPQPIERLDVLGVLIHEYQLAA